MSKEKFLMFASIKKDDEKNIAFHRLTPWEAKHTAIINTEDKYLWLDANFIHLLAALSEKQLKEVFKNLDNGFQLGSYAKDKTSKDNLVKAVLEMIDSKHTTYGRFIVDFTGTI